jgi:uncharacterized ferritin-like protein (DUF455 family)
MNIYTSLEVALQSCDILQKETIVNNLICHCSQNSVTTLPNREIKSFPIPSYASICTIVEPSQLNERKKLDTQIGLATLIHAIVHIEYSAIDLALDAVYRFDDMPQAYYMDWLEVADDEIRHFKMLESILHEVGYKYGDFSVHSGLWDIANRTNHSAIDRMAVVPRYFEASGLDVNPQIMKKLHNQRKIPLVKALIDALDIIYKEEINHVQKGDKWFKYLCTKNGEDVNSYMEILNRYNLLSRHRPHINVEARIEAGFSCQELQELFDAKCQ